MGKRGLIRVVRTRVVSGIIEKHYQVTAREFNVDRRLLSPHGDARDEGDHMTLLGTLAGLEMAIYHLNQPGR